MLSYSFCFPNNRYDSFEFYLRTKLQPLDLDKLILLELPDDGTKTTRIRLKTDQLNERLITVLRCLNPRKSLKEPWDSHEVRTL